MENNLIMSYKNYKDYSEYDKKTIIESLYIDQRLSFGQIADKLGTYSNKIRRDAIKYKIKIRDKSQAQSNAIKNGSHKHPTKGSTRSENTKNKIGKSVMESWENLTNKQLDARRKKSKQLWNKLSEDEKQARLNLANLAVRESSKVGSKLEHFLLQKLIEDGYKVDFHKERLLTNTKLQIDLFIPNMDIAIEVDGPSHFLPVWGEETLKKNKKYDKKKAGLIIGKGLKLIRIKQIHDYSKARALILYPKLVHAINTLKNSNNKSIEIED